MKKEELLKKVEGLSDDVAEKVLKAFEGYVPKTRFDEVNEAKKNAEALVKERDTQIEKLKQDNKGNEDLKNQIAKLQDDNKKAVEAKDAEIKKIKIDNAVNTALIGAGAKNTKAVLALLKLDGAELADDGTVKGLSEQIDALKKAEDSSFLFKSEGKNPSPKKGVTPKGNNDPKGNGTVTKEQFAKMGYKERVELFNTDRELYDSLIKEE